jgi:hypothetical protein
MLFWLFFQKNPLKNKWNKYLFLILHYIGGDSMTKAIIAFAVSAALFFSVHAEESIEAQRKHKAKVCWLIGHFSKKGIKEKKAKELLAHYAKITDENLKSLTKKHFQKTINKTEDVLLSEKLSALFAKLENN